MSFSKNNYTETATIVYASLMLTALIYFGVFHTKRPSVRFIDPGNKSENVEEHTTISTININLPNGGLDKSTVNAKTVILTEEETGTIVPASVTTSNDQKEIKLIPTSALKLRSTYIFTITHGVKDIKGASFTPFTSRFTTVAIPTEALTGVAFEKVILPNSTGQHTTLTIGPDGKLYALSITGLITRFVIKPDGTLQDPDSLFTLQDAYGKRQERVAIGLCFDPSSTANHLIAYVTHQSAPLIDGPQWDSKLTRLSGPNLQKVQDIIVHLPRSLKDHFINSVAFGPDGSLYFNLGSMSAMGAGDDVWGNRKECLLSAAVLRLDLTKCRSLPLDVKTSDGGGTYNPYADGAPLTIYASGLRNAYDLTWHSNGNLYIAVNGSNPGGNTPASVNGVQRPDETVYDGPKIPALTNVREAQNDFLFRVVKGGYYGHPNPLRGEYVMNGGNPTAGTDSAEVRDYPSGTLPDKNYRGYSYNFQNFKSPDGTIEYTSNKFNGALRGKLLIVRYSQGDDIITLTPGGPKGDIISVIGGHSIEGFSGFIDPLDLTEDVKSGNIYVSEFGGSGRISLLRAKE